MTEPLRTYSVPETCALLHVTRRTLSRWVRQRRLKKTKVGGRTLFREAELSRLLDRGTR